MRAIWGFIFAILTIWAPFSAAQSGAVEGVAPESESETETETETNTKWVICNETSFILRVAIALGEGSLEPDNAGHKSTVRVKGWNRLRPSECLQELLPPTIERYVFAESDPVHNGGIREWAGQYPICVNPDADFDINTVVSCALQGLETRRFLRANPEDPVSKFIEPDDFGDKSKTAGLQRLMKDAGYKISRIDGISGRRTRDTLKQFLKDSNVDADLPVLLQIDALAKTAETKQELSGLTVCNQTANLAWLAIGFREDGAWQSRGWWNVQPEGCIRPWSKNMTGVEMHIYAQQDIEDGALRILKNPVETANNFCIAEGKFSALGRDFCVDQGYVSADFRPLITEERGVKIDLKPEDFNDFSSGGLRQ